MRKCWENIKRTYYGTELVSDRVNARTDWCLREERALEFEGEKTLTG